MIPQKNQRRKVCVVQDFLLLELIQQHAWRMGNGNWKHHKPKLKVICLSTNIIIDICVNYWEVYFLQHTGKPNSDNVPALISVSCVAVVASVLMFIIGFVCGHCFSHDQRRKKLTQHEQTMSMSTAAASNEPEGDLELKDNVAYVTLRPK